MRDDDAAPLFFSIMPRLMILAMPECRITTSPSITAPRDYALRYFRYAADAERCVDIFATCF